MGRPRASSQAMQPMHMASPGWLWKVTRFSAGNVLPQQWQATQAGRAALSLTAALRSPLGLSVCDGTHLAGGAASYLSVWWDVSARDPGRRMATGLRTCSGPGLAAP
jgi:hypothetical protein